LRVGSCQARVLSTRDVHAHNDFAHPRAVERRDEPANVHPNGAVVFRFAPASVIRLKMSLV
jgi:alpha-N-arabinofuranosidase